MITVTNLIAELFDLMPCSLFLNEEGLRHAKTCLRAYADNEGPDQTAHLRSLIKAFAARKQNHLIQRRFQCRANTRMRLFACAG